VTFKVNEGDLDFVAFVAVDGTSRQIQAREYGIAARCGARRF
jgi:hypothetical protein